MSRTLTAMFDSRSEAESACKQIRSLGGTAEIRDQSHLSSGTYSDQAGTAGGLTASPSQSSRASPGSSRGFWADLKDAFVADEDRPSYEEGMRRGSVLLTAHVDESRADEAIRILDQCGTVDLDEREQSWRKEGWQAPPSSTMSSPSPQPQQGFTSTGQQSSMRSPPPGSTQEEHIPIVEEQLRVGKREVSRGGARVRSYIEETPVTESVSLREEHVNIERRPVDQPLGAAGLPGDAFQERTVEMRETAEEAVVAKEARVKEELVVSKSSTEHQEQIQDTVRHTKVEVDDRVDSDRQPGLGGGDKRERDPSAFGFDKR